MGESALRERYVDAGELTLHVVSAGPENGQPIVLLHGFPELWYGWRRQIDVLAAAGLHVIAPDQRGYNLSDKPEDAAAYSGDHLVRDVLGLLDAFGLDRAILCGHDWGGVVAWWTAQRAPERTSGIVAINAPHPDVFRQAVLTNPAQAIRSARAYLMQPTLRRLTRELKEKSKPGAFSDADLQIYRAAWERPGALAGMSAWYRAAIRRGWVPPARADERKIAAPALLVWGLDDPYLLPELAQDSLRKCRDARLVPVPDTTHWVHHEAPDRVNGAVLDFVALTTAPTPRRVHAPEPVAVIGAGIGGLTTGIALARRGIEVDVYERAPALRATGGGLILWTNAVHALSTLGLRETVLDAGCEIQRTEVRAWDGRLLWTIPVGDLGRSLGAPTVVIHRARLLQLLADAARSAGARIHFDRACLGFAEGPTSVWLAFEDLPRVHASAAIAADGIHSVLRGQLLGVEPPRVHGQVGFGGIVQLDHPNVPRGTTVATVGLGPRIAASHMGGGQVYWHATVPRPLGRGRADPTRKEDLLQLYADCHAPAFDLIERTGEAALLHNDVVDRPPAKRWASGRVALLGDAAHPMTPDLGQGACQAIEDAVCLARCLSCGLDSGERVSAALQTYQELRRPRASRIQEMARISAKNSVIADPLFCRLRDTGFSSIFPAVARREIEWVLSHRV